MLKSLIYSNLEDYHIAYWNCPALTFAQRNELIGGLNYPKNWAAVGHHHRRFGQKPRIQWVLAQHAHAVGFSINGGTPTWMLYDGKSIYKWMIWGYPHDLGNLHIIILLCLAV